MTKEELDYVSRDTKLLDEILTDRGFLAENASHQEKIEALTDREFWQIGEEGVDDLVMPEEMPEPEEIDGEFGEDEVLEEDLKFIQ
jgi:hypothetical protein